MLAFLHLTFKNETYFPDPRKKMQLKKVEKIDYQRKCQLDHNEQTYIKAEVENILETNILLFAIALET